MTDRLLRVEGLTVDYRRGRSRFPAVRDVSFHVDQGETVALVGGSGSGKSTTAHSIVRLLPRNGVIGAGQVYLGSDELTRMKPRALRGVRGLRVGFIPQDPTVSLNPVLRIGRQVAEVLILHGLADRHTAPRMVADALEAAGLDRPEARMRQYPHELSGGMRQRVLIAIALATNPSLVIADEATSALDVTVQRQILNHLELMTTERGTGLLMITHDLGVAADRADRIIVMSNGRIVEEGKPSELLDSPRDAYTAALLNAAPSLNKSTRSLAVIEPARPSTVEAVNEPDTPPILVAEHLVKEFTVPGPRGKETMRAVDDVCLSVARGKTLAIVGESGSGKTTTSRLLLRLTDPTAGRILVDGHDVTQVGGEALRSLRQRMQVVFQNPYVSLNPRLSVGAIVAEPLRSFRIGKRSEQTERAAVWLERVGLPRSVFDRRPSELSGGQRQRVAIARAMVLDPQLVVLDEPVSALDVLVQAQILKQLVDLQDEFGLSYIFISHDLAVVRQLAHDVSVMQRGKVVETGAVIDVLHNPAHPYTQDLIAAIPGAGVRSGQA